MTAEEAYAKTMKARRNYVLEQIEASAHDCRFEIRIWHTYLYKELEDELIAEGYTVSSNEDWVTISWSSPRKMRLQQSSRQLISIEWKNS